MNGPGGHPIIHGTGLHETTVDNEWQGAATSVAYKRFTRVLHYMGISQQEPGAIREAQDSGMGVCRPRWLFPNTA